jgi:hypothetical protein
VITDHQLKRQNHDINESSSPQEDTLTKKSADEMTEQVSVISHSLGILLNT